MNTMTAGPSTVELKSVHGREPFRWGRPQLDHQEGVGPAPLSTMNFGWWRRFAVRLGSDAMGSEDLSMGGCQPTPTHVIRDLETIDSELRFVAALRRAARERGGPLPSIDVADALLG